jgi:lipoate-protein ligase A
MKYLDLTLLTPEENLACDEALLDWCDSGSGPEVLRFWEAREYFVVVGYSNHVAREVNVAACRKRGIPILRRCTGGGTVLQGPGCLNYSLVLRIESEPALQTVTGTNRFVMERNRAALETLLLRGGQLEDAPPFGPEPTASGRRLLVRGHTDLSIDDRKFSGNAQRRKRRALLFHGSFLLTFDLSLVSELLPFPSKQPGYRQSRSHGEFLRNFESSASETKAALRRAWGATRVLRGLSAEITNAPAMRKYLTDAWHLKL